MIITTMNIVQSKSLIPANRNMLLCAFGGGWPYFRHRDVAWFRLLLRGLSLGKTRFLVEVSLDDVAGRGRGICTLHADVFPQHSDADFGLLAGSVGDEPAVVLYAFVG